VAVRRKIVIIVGCYLTSSSEYMPVAVDKSNDSCPLIQIHASQIRIQLQTFRISQNSMVLPYQQHKYDWVHFLTFWWADSNEVTFIINSFFWFKNLVKEMQDLCSIHSWPQRIGQADGRLVIASYRTGYRYLSRCSTQYVRTMHTTLRKVLHNFHYTWYLHIVMWVAVTH
jgi:hypothetical protein